MSHCKRPWDSTSIGTVSSEAVRARRRTTQPFNRPPTSSNDTDSDDDSSSRSTTSVTTVSTPASYTLSNALAPSRTTNGQNNIVFGYTQEDQPSKALVCFGSVWLVSSSEFRETNWNSQLLDGRMMPCGQSKSLYTRLGELASKGDVALRLRFRNDCISLLLDTEKEVAMVDQKMTIALRSLKEIAPETTFKVFLGHEISRGDLGRREEKPAVGLPLEIEVFGLDENFSEIGSALSDVGMYLQEPVALDQGDMYRNPHFFSWDGSSTAPQLKTFEPDLKADFETNIEAIFESSTPVSVALDVKQDARILTQLRRYFRTICCAPKKLLMQNAKSHQLSALKFMIIREEECHDTLSLWEPHCVNRRTG